VQTFIVVGQGSIGKRHLANLKNLYPKSQLISVSSSGKARVLEQADICLNSFDSLSQYAIDGIIVASPASLHAEHVEQLAHFNVPLLIEKPIAVTVEQNNVIINAVKNSKVCIGYCLRFLPSAQKVKQLISSQSLGKVYSVHACVGQHLSDWRKDKSYHQSVSAQKSLGGGALLELSHEFDYLQWIFGKLELLHAELRKSHLLETDVEEIADIMLKSEQGVIIHLHLNFIQRPAQRECRIIAEDGTLVWNLISNSVTLTSLDRNDTLYQDENWDKNQMYTTMITQFFSHDNIEKTSLASVSEASDVVNLISQIKQYCQWS